MNGPTVASSRAIATRYFNDLNSKNKDDAVTLICAAGKSQFQKRITEPNSDFDYTWSNVVYVQAGAVGNDTTALGYTATVSDGSRSQNLQLILYFVNENGAKLCGQKTT